MEQRKRPGGKNGAGYFTSWEKNKKNGCIYCGQPAKTREHVPSKTFLIEPYPENLPTIPACVECNNGFSADELYVSCFLDSFKEIMYSNYTVNAKTARQLEKKPALSKKIKDDIQNIDGKIHVSFDESRLVRIMTKLAQGHAGFEFDDVTFDKLQEQVAYDFVFDLSESEIMDFDQISEMNLAPEYDSRCGWENTPFIIQNIVTGEVLPVAFWNYVQDGQYRYQVYYNNDRHIEVKIVILEILYCRITFY